MTISTGKKKGKSRFQKFFLKKALMAFSAEKDSIVVRNTIQVVYVDSRLHEPNQEGALKGPEWKLEREDASSASVVAEKESKAHTSSKAVLKIWHTTHNNRTLDNAENPLVCHRPHSCKKVHRRNLQHMAS